LDDVGQGAADGIAMFGRRYGVAVASSGLIVTMAVPASAAPLEQPGGSAPGIDVAALTAPARSALATSPVVAVSSDATWTFETPAISVTANPKPEPVVERAAAASRSEPRAAAQAIGGAIPASAVGSAVIEIAARYVGTPYAYGGATPDGFDCSGFTSYVYAQLGITLPRASADQLYAGVQVPRDQAQPGDLVWSPGHVGIYAGDNTMIDSPRPGKSVQFREMWQSNPIFIRVTG
jgi:cell wall-associated NlpC family hydrolase